MPMYGLSLSMSLNSLREVLEYLAPGGMVTPWIHENNGKDRINAWMNHVT